MNFDVNKILELISFYGLQILGALAILVAGRYAIKLVVSIARKAMTVSKVDTTLISFLCNVISALGMAFIVIAALGQLGIQTTSLAAIIGAAGLAIGLALQGSLGNLASGVLIIALRPFSLGDVIEVVGKKGTVKDINIFTTTLHAEDGSNIIIPNGKITNDIIVTSKKA
jgi:small conductance mechanosensitive channel